MLTGTQYTYRHNQVAKYVHWCILKEKGIEVTESWMKHEPKNVTTKDRLAGKNQACTEAQKHNKSLGQVPEAISNDQKPRNE